MLRMRTHGSALTRPALALVLLGGALGVGAALVPTAYRPGDQYVVVAAVLALACRWSVLPYLRWRSRTYTLTDQRLLTREGVVHRFGHDLPLDRVLHVSSQRGLADRMLGRGALHVQTAGEGALVLEGVPDVELVQLTVTELLAGRPDPVGPGPEADRVAAFTEGWAPGWPGPPAAGGRRR